MTTAEIHKSIQQDAKIVMRTAWAACAISVLIAVATARGDGYSAWDNYYPQYGDYFDRFFNKPRILYFVPDRLAHARTVRVMAAYGVPYTDQYTGQYNGVQTAAHIWNTSRTAEEYRARLKAWAKN